jgi:asparagine synthase (glutamine-hydrolysing)
LKGLNEKYILKKVAEKRSFPKAILERPKQAYRAPIERVLWGGEFRNRFSNILDNKRINQMGLFDETKVFKLLNKFDNRGQVSETDRMALTGILSVQILYDYFINKKIKPLKESDLIRIDKIIFQN